MSEDDRFTKRLIWGFKKAYRLCISGSTSDVVIKTACRAIGKAIKDGQLDFQIVPEALEVILRALRKVASQKEELFPIDADVRESMYQDLQALMIRGKLEEVNRLCIEVAGEVFEKFIEEENCNREAIVDCFNVQLAGAVLDRNLFAVAASDSTVRMETCIKTDRKKHDQEQFEQEVKEGVAEWVSTYLQHLEKHEKPPLRMPSLPRIKTPFRLEEVHKGL